MVKIINCEHGQLLLEQPEREDGFRRTFIVGIQNNTSKGFLLLDWDWIEREVKIFFGQKYPALTIQSVEIYVDQQGPFARIRHA